MTLPAFAVHPGAWVAVLAATAGYWLVIRNPHHAVTRRKAWAFLGAMAVLLVSLTWPLADIATHHLLVALVVQRLLLLLAVPPLVIAGVPRTLVAAATKPPAFDSVARALSRPAPAVVVVTVVCIGTLTTPAVGAQASSALARGGLDALLLVAGVVMWLPVLHPLPGTERVSALGRAGYLVVQSIVPNFLSIVWIFARHPLYPAYSHAGTYLGLSPVVDQQLSGFVAKLVSICVLWTVAFVALSRSERVAEQGGDPDPLTWADVERQLERVERRERRGPGAPREVAGAPPGGEHRKSASRRGVWRPSPGWSGLWPSSPPSVGDDHGDDPAGGPHPGGG